MVHNGSIIQKLSTEKSLELLVSQTFGRLVVRRKDDMDLFPLDYVVHEGSIYFRTAEGSKLFTVFLSHDAPFEADFVDKDAQKAQSVIVRGDAEVPTSRVDINAVDELPLKPWLLALKCNYVRITPNDVSGRHSHPGEEPNRYEVQRRHPAFLLYDVGGSVVKQSLRRANAVFRYRVSSLVVFLEVVGLNYPKAS